MGMVWNFLPTQFYKPANDDSMQEEFNVVENILYIRIKVYLRIFSLVFEQQLPTSVCCHYIYIY